MISRHWGCQHCARQFHSFDNNPECPGCGSVKVAWVPKAIHTARHTQVDQTVRQLADSYGMTDVNTPSPSRLNRAMPKVEPRAADGPVLNFAPGFSAPVNLQGLSTCEPSRAGVNFRATVAPGQRMIGPPPKNMNFRSAPLGPGSQAMAAAVARGGKRPARG